MTTALTANTIERTKTTLSIEVVAAYGGGVYIHMAAAGEKTDALLTVEEARHLAALLSRMADETPERLARAEEYQRGIEARCPGYAEARAAAREDAR